MLTSLCSTLRLWISDLSYLEHQPDDDGGDDEADDEADEEDPINMEIFNQIIELDEDDEDLEFSTGMVEAYFAQADKTFTDMDEAL